MNKIIEDALKSTFNFIGQSIEFIIGLIGVATVTALSLSGEVIDEITTYQALKTAEGFPWAHVAKVMIPPMAVSIAAYMQHRRMMAQAINAPAPPPTEKATMVTQ